MKSTRRAAFTLIEILIVVVIMAVLAATIIPQFSTSVDDSKSSALKFNLHTLRQQVDQYKIQHNQAIPNTITAGALPQFSGTTDATGATGSGASFPLGPYVNVMPNNPYDNKATISSTTGTIAAPPAASTAAGGWLYNTTTGDIFANTTGHLAD